MALKETVTSMMDLGNEVWVSTSEGSIFVLDAKVLSQFLSVYS